MAKTPSDEFIELASEIASLAKDDQINIVPFSDPTLPHFSALSDSQKERVLWQLRTLCEIGRRIRSKSESLADSKALLREFFDITEFLPPPDLMNWIKGDEFIDVWDDSHQLIIGNYVFFRVISYSLEEVYCRPWMQLFYRPNERAHELLLGLSMEILQGKHFTVVETRYIPPHLVSEIDSPRRAAAWITPKLFAPLFRDGKIVGYFVVNEGRVLETTGLQKTEF
jgi:hypothetical protein